MKKTLSQDDRSFIAARVRETVRTNIWYVLGSLAVLILTYIVLTSFWLSINNRFLQEIPDSLPLIGSLLGFLFSMLYIRGCIMMTLVYSFAVLLGRLYRHEAPDLKHLLHGWKTIRKLLVLPLIKFLWVLIPFVLLMIVSIIIVEIDENLLLQIVTVWFGVAVSIGVALYLCAFVVFRYFYVLCIMSEESELSLGKVLKKSRELLKNRGWETCGFCLRVTVIPVLLWLLVLIMDTVFAQNLAVSRALMYARYLIEYVTIMYQILISYALYDRAAEPSVSPETL